MKKYEVVFCPNCRTEMHITNSNRKGILKCLCGKSFMAVSFNGKYELMEALKNDKNI